MRIANLDGRLVLAVAGGYIDVATASAGVFGPDPQPVYEQWEAFTGCWPSLSMPMMASVSLRTGLGRERPRSAS